MDPFEAVVLEDGEDAFASLSRKAVSAPPVPAVPGVVTARLHGFDLEDRPLVAGTSALPHEILPARATIALRRADIGATVVVAFEDGDVRRPIVLGVVAGSRPREAPQQAPAKPVTIQADGEKFVVDAEREITLRCGEASITLTRAGKVIIKGAYIVSRSTGHNKIKGAAVDIN
jgi:hypothetical protein